MEFLDLLLEVIAKTLNLDKQGVAELVKSEDGKAKPEALQTLIDKYSEHLKKVKTESIDEGYKKATRIEREALEKQMKEAVGITTDKKGAELALFIKEQSEASARESGKEITEDVVKKHPAYLNLERTALAEKAKFEKDKEDAINTLKKDYQAKETFQTVSQKALDKLLELKPILSDNPKVAANQKKVFLDKLKEAEYSIDGDKINVLKDGQNLKTDLGHLVPFETFIENIAKEYYDFKVADDRSSSGADNKGGDGKGKDQKLDVPKTQDEFTKRFFAEQDATKRIELKKAFDESQKALGEKK